MGHLTDFFTSFDKATTATAAVVVFSCGALLVYKLHTPQSQKESFKVYSDAPGIAIDRSRAIISCQNDAYSTKGNRLTALEARAKPNERIGRIFGVHNSFTTTDPQRNKEFHQLSKQTIDLSATDWYDLYSEAAHLVMQKVDTKQLGADHGVPIMAFVQNLTLKMTLRALFDLNMEAQDLDDAATDTVAEEINRLWMASKDAKDTQRFADQHVLQDALCKLIPAANFAPEDNPLNLILPAYETMWRVVLLGYLECYHRLAHGRTAIERARDIMRHVPLIVDVPKGKAKDYPLGPGFTAFDVAAEALRLYPSNKRIYRSVSSGDADTLQTVSADLEAMHHDPNIWSSTIIDGQRQPANPDVFDPSRHASLTPEQINAYVPFGIRPFICPAKSDYGERMIALLIAALAKGTEDWTVDECGTSHLQGQDLLPCGREDLAEWRLVRKT